MKDSAAGMAAGAVARIFVAPLDVLKIRRQVDTAGGSSRGALVREVRSVLSTHGIRGFWRGNLSATALWASYSFVQFPAYARARAANLPPLVSGGLAGGLATVVTYPLDVLRTVKVASDESYLQACARPTRLVRGLGPALLSVTPTMSVTFLVYEKLSSESTALKRSGRNDDEYSPARSAVSGAVAGLSGKLASYPLDTIKRRQQVVAPIKDSAWRVFSNTLRAEGIVGLYKGAAPSMLKAMVSTATTLSAYEFAARI